MSITENIERVKNRIETAALRAGRNPRDINLVAASKTNSAEMVKSAISAGIKICGENRVQELTEKKAQGAYEGAGLHFIGHLQKNKVRQVVGHCDLIQSIDSLELLRLVNSRAENLGLCQDVLLEVNIAAEATKGGFSTTELPEVLAAFGGFSALKLRGLMAIPPISAENSGNSEYFARMYKLFIDISAKKYDNVYMDFLSMGMSNDFEDAIAEGSNMIRVGSAIFGARDYT